jgi:hypothetical protein
MTRRRKSSVVQVVKDRVRTRALVYTDHAFDEMYDDQLLEEDVS